MSSAKARLRSRKVREAWLKHRTRGAKRNSIPKLINGEKEITAVTGRERVDGTFWDGQKWLGTSQPRL